MSSPQTFPYDTRLNILHQPLELIDVNALARSVTHKWFNQTLCQVNASVVRVGVIEGEYHWHKHDADDEFFYVVEGQLLIDLEGRVVTLSPGQGMVIPKGVAAPHPRAAAHHYLDGGERRHHSDRRLADRRLAGPR